MPQANYTIENALPLLQEGALILVPDYRLAKNIKNAWGEYCQAEGSHSWPSPRVYVLHSWLENTWQELADLGHREILKGQLISPFQEQCIWEKIISSSDTFYPLQLAATASRAYDSFQQWQLTLTDINADEGPFANWLLAFRRQLDDHNLITQADLTTLIINAYKDGVLEQEPLLGYTGFATISPLQQALFSTISGTLFPFESTGFKSGSEVYAASAHSYEQELTMAAQWAAACLGDNPSRIGIVVPQLANSRLQAERIFRKAFEKQPTAGMSPGFHIGGGTPLSDSPAVHAAFLLLGLNRETLPQSNLGEVLRSPFWGGSASSHDSATVRSHAEYLLTELGSPELRTSTLRFLVHEAEQQLPDLQCHLSQQLEQFATLRRQAPSKQAFSQWLSLFSDQLTALGWSGCREPNSREGHQIENWQKLLSESPQLDALLGEITTVEALSQIQRRARSTLINDIPQSEQECPVLVLTPIESASLNFDYLWVTGMDATSWPAPCQPNPLLPGKLQLQKKMPKADPQEELHLAGRLVDQFSRNAKTVVFSYSQTDGDTEQLPSPLIAGFPVKQFTLLQQQLATSPELETISDQYGQPLDLDRGAVKGGATLFRDQALCPFNSYARHRLGAIELKKAQLGLTPMDRGNMIHSCLEKLWRELEGSDTLSNLGEESLRQIVNSAVQSTLSYWQKKRPDLLHGYFLQLEVQRLTGLLQQWLALEAQRPAFEVIACEQRLETTFAGIPLTLRIDRLDQVDGQLSLMDYKTGKPRGNPVSGWDGYRLEEPQLPLYALCLQSRPGAVVFGFINTRTRTFAGLSIGHTRNEALLPGLFTPGSRQFSEEPDVLFQRWQKALETVAEEFKSGLAEVRFNNLSNADLQAELHCLNRWPEIRQHALFDVVAENGTDA